MQKTNLTLKEICEQAYHIFEMRGYEPKYLDEEHTNFSCLINGIKFSFCSLEDDLFWFGYIVAYWFFLDGTTGKEMLHKYDMKHSLDGYDVLHTLSVRTAIEKIKEDDAL